MRNVVQLAILGVTLLTSSLPSSKLASASPLTPFQEPSNADIEWFQSLLKGAGLLDRFDFLRIGTGPHPDPVLALDSLIQHLELGFRDDSSNETDKLAHFQEVLEQYQAKHSTALPAKLFYEFVHAFALDRLKACVDFHVGEVIYSTYVSRQDSSLIVRQGGKRSRSGFSVVIPPAAPQEMFSTRMGKQPLPDAKSVSDAVEKILTVYLIEASRKGGVKPDITPERDDGHLGLSVQAKALVTDRFWEWIQIDVEFHNDSASAKEPKSQWMFACYLGVKYASSPRERSPTDADSDYSMQVENFRKKVRDQLQTNLGKGIHD